MAFAAEFFLLYFCRMKTSETISFDTPEALERAASLSNRVCQLLRNQIIQGRLKPGQKLDIFELAAKLKVSRSPIKEAFNRLAHEGLVTIQPQRGTFVTVLGPEDVEQIFDARLMVELWAAKKIAEHRETLQLDKMREALWHSEPVLETPEKFNYLAYNEGDVAFHSYIVQAAGNSRLSEIYQLLNVHVQAMRIYWAKAYKRAVESHGEHLQIAAAFENGQFHEVERLLTKHIVGSKNHLLEVIRENSPR